VFSTAHEVERAALESDVVIGAVLIPGAKAPTLVSDDLVSRMHPSVLVDIAVDQGRLLRVHHPTPTRTGRPVKERCSNCVQHARRVPATSTLR